MAILTHQQWTVLMNVLNMMPYLKVTHHRRRLQTAFSENLWQLSHNVAVNWDSTKMRHSWTQRQTNYRGSTQHYYRFFTSHCKKIAFSSAVNKGSTLGIASAWKGVLTMHWTLSKTTALHFGPLHSATIQKGCLKHLQAWQKLAFTSEGQISEVSVQNFSIW